MPACAKAVTTRCGVPLESIKRREFSDGRSQVEKKVSNVPDRGRYRVTDEHLVDHGEQNLF